MRLLKKLAIAAVAAMTAMVMAVPAFADDATYSVTVQNANEGHTFYAYQIFTGDLHNGTLSNVQWGTGVTKAGQDKFGAASDVAKGVTDADSFARQISDYLATESASAEVGSDGTCVLSDLETGYYLIRDVAPANSHSAYTEYIVRVVGEDLVVNTKTFVPQVFKKTKDSNDSTAAGLTDWQDSGDFDLGDTVPFKIEANLAENVAAYETYKVIFHDTMSAGLTFNEITAVKIDGNPITSGYAVKAEVAENGQTALTVTFDDVKVLGAVNGSEVVVEYTATLNENAVIGAAGNPNKVYLEYSNNPYGTETGSTVEDKVIIFTYQLDVNKVDASRQALKGAGFTLFKVIDGAEVKIGNELVGGDMTTFTWKGLDDGSYVLKETTTPGGYNTIAPISFTITATHDIDSADPKLTALVGGNTFFADMSTGVLAGEVINQTGAQLPTTGGMGTTLLYVAGAALILGAGIALVVRKRARNS